MPQVRHLNDRQRRFADHVASGMPAGRAYTSVGYNSEGNTANTAAAKLLKNPAVADHLRKLRKTRERKAVLTLEMKRNFLYRLVTTPISEIPPDSDLWQSDKTSQVSLPSKLKAIELDEKLIPARERIKSFSSATKTVDKSPPSPAPVPQNTTSELSSIPPIPPNNPTWNWMDNHYHPKPSPDPPTFPRPPSSADPPFRRKRRGMAYVILP